MDTLKLPGQQQGESLEEAVKRLIQKGAADALISSEGSEGLYSLAYGFYNSGQYDKAMHFFRFLTLVDPSARKQWMGLGAAYQMLKQYERALQCYAQAAALNPQDPYAHWHAAECFLAIKDYEQAKLALDSAEKMASPSPSKYRSLLDKLDLLKNGPRPKKSKKLNKMR